MLMLLPVYLLVGTIAGVLAGLLGVGGGLIVVPALLFLLPFSQIPPEHLMHVAAGTSLAAIVLTALASVRAHQRRGAIDWQRFLNLSPALGLGAWAAGQLAAQLASETLTLLFAVFVLYMGLKLWRAAGQSKPARAVFPGLWWLSGLGIGVLSGLVGIGGGSLLVPLLYRHGLSMPTAVATSAACGLAIALFGALGYVMAGWAVVLPAGHSGFVYWPAVAGLTAASMLSAPVGARLAHRWPAARLKRIFAGFLLTVAVTMVARVLSGWF